MHDDAAEPPGTSTTDKPIVRLRHPSYWISAAVGLVLLAMAINSWVTNDAYNWPEIGKYLFAEQVLNGVKNTIWLTVVAMTIGVVLGTVIAMMRRSRNPVLRSVAWFYIWIFRGTPLYTQLLIWASLGAVYPKLSVGIPFGPEFASVETNRLLSAAFVAVIGLGMNEAAYMSEIVRAGIGSVDYGQVEAAWALGYTPAATFRRVVLPQALRLIVPPTGNQIIIKLKDTALVSVIPYLDLTFAVRGIYGRTLQIIPMLLMACLWYLAMTSLLMFAQSRVERYFARGVAGQ
jgi:polar amino acid transport system permease protein